MKQVKLINTENKFALVDDEDYEKVSKYNWIIDRGYVSRTYKRRNQRLGKFILGIGSEVILRYKNGNGLDNTKENLVIYAKTQIKEEGGLVYIYFRNGKIAFTDKKNTDIVNKFYWQITKDNYVNYEINRKGLKRKKVFLHTVLMNPPEGLTVDHINRNPLDNRLCNLRVCTKAENMRNAGKRSIISKSVYKGITPKRGGWEAYVCYNRKRYYAGWSKIEEIAAAMYDKKAIELHKEFASLNFPNGK